MDVFVARQPIFDRRLKVCAYELLYRAHDRHNAFTEGTEANMASSSVIVHSFHSIGMDSIAGGKKVFINFTRDLLNQEVATLFPKGTLVVEVMEDIDPDAEVVESIAQLKRLGYTIALDNFACASKLKDFVNLADIIIFDLIATPLDKVVDIVKGFKGKKVQFLAQKVESHDTFIRALDMGFHYFQGFFFAKPDIVTARDAQPMSINCVRLVREANKADLNFQAMARIISRDASLTYKLLKLINTVGFGYRYRIMNVQHALVCLGEVETRKWVTLLSMMASGDNNNDELLKLSLVRARFMETVGVVMRMSEHTERLFMLGLFSLMERIMGRPIAEVFDGIYIPDETINALVHGKGPYVPTLNLMLAYESGDWDTVNAMCDTARVSAESVIQCYIDALDWCERIFT